MMPQSARILATACPKPTVLLEDCQAGYGRVICSASPQRSRYTGPLSFPPSCTMQRPGFSIGSRSGYWSGFTNAACAPSLASKWQDHVSNEEILKRASLPNIESILLQVQLRGADHVTRMEDVRMPKAVVISELQERKRHRCARRKRYKDQLKRQLVQTGISHQSWRQEASDRDSWRLSMRKAGCEFEAERLKAAKAKRRRQKELAASLISSFQTFVCPKCCRGCASKIGLYNRQRACTN